MTVFDGVLLIVVILCVIVGLRRGFVLTLCGLLSIVIALVGAKVAADQFSPTVTQAIAPDVYKRQVLGTGDFPQKWEKLACVHWLWLTRRNNDDTIKCYEIMQTGVVYYVDCRWLERL